MREQATNKELIVNDESNQFEIHFDEGPAFIEFVKRDNKIHLTHTEVPDALEGKGVASVLVEKSLEYIKQNNLIVIPSCSFVAHYINNHPKWHSLLSEGYQM